MSLDEVILDQVCLPLLLLLLLVALGCALCVAQMDLLLGGIAFECCWDLEFGHLGKKHAQFLTLLRHVRLVLHLALLMLDEASLGVVPVD